MAHNNFGARNGDYLGDKNQPGTPSNTFNINDLLQITSDGDTYISRYLSVGYTSLQSTYNLDLQGTSRFTDDFLVGGNTLFVDVSSGYIGVNKLSPTKALDIVGDQDITGTITCEELVADILTLGFNTEGVTSSSFFQHTDNENDESHIRHVWQSGGPSGGDALIQVGINNTRFWSFGVDNSDSDKLIIGTKTNSSIENSSDNTSVIVANTAGNVGMGNVTNPATKLDIGKDIFTPYNDTTDQRNSALLTIRNYDETTSSFASLSLYSGGGLGAEWSINNVRTGTYSGDLAFKTRIGSASWIERVRFSREGNLGLGVSSFGTSGVNVIGISADGTVPTTSPPGMIQIFADDSSDGVANATLALRTEQAVVAASSFTISHELKLWINGNEYAIALRAIT